MMSPDGMNTSKPGLRTCNTYCFIFFSLSLFESGEYMWLGIFVVCVSVDVCVFRLS